MSYRKLDLPTIAAFGRIEKAQQAKKQNTKFTKEFCYIAAENGEVGIVKWCIENNIPINNLVWWFLKDAGVDSKTISVLKSEWQQKNKA